jgi:ribosome maturation factor RimP
MKIDQNIVKIIEDALVELDCTLFDIEYEKSGSDLFLRVFVDHKDGVDLELCVKATEVISPLLDDLDFFKQEYYLEVASPGAERELKTDDHIKGAVGSHIYVKTYAPINKQKEFTGDLVSFENDVVTLDYMDKTRKKTVEIEKDKIAKIRLAVKF